MKRLSTDPKMQSCGARGFPVCIHKYAYAHAHMQDRTHTVIFAILLKHTVVHLALSTGYTQRACLSSFTAAAVASSKAVGSVAFLGQVKEAEVVALQIAHDESLALLSR